MKRFVLLAIVGMVVSTSGWAAAPMNGPAAMEKKLIEYGWDVPTPDFVRAHIREMEQKPFDGLIFKLQGGGNVLEPEAWDPARFTPDYENLRQIEWDKFTHNFIIMWAASAQDWFNDDHWTAIEKNTGLVAKAGRLGGCVGFCFDPEPYGQNPWDYSQVVHKDTKTFEEYQRKVRERGAQFMRAIDREFPNPTILSLYQIALLGEFCRPMKPEDRVAGISKHSYGLYPAFLNGMLEAAGPGTILIDGNESAYYYEDSAPYYSAYHVMKQDALYLVDPSLWGKYRAQVQAGQALYVDQYFGLRAEKVLGNKMTPDERPKWFEHNVYNSLKTSDGFVWCYSERMNWWTNTDVPPGCEDAVRSAREKLSTGQSLGFDLGPIVEEAKKRP